MITEQIIFLGNFLIQANMRISRVVIKVDSLLWGIPLILVNFMIWKVTLREESIVIEIPPF